MPLTDMAQMFPDIGVSDQKTLVSRPCWLYVERCNTWDSDSPNEKWPTFLVYKSPMVTATSRMYREVANLILQADDIEVLVEARGKDSHMMHGEAEVLMFRINAPDVARRKYSRELIEAVLGDRVFEQTMQYIQMEVV